MLEAGAGEQFWTDVIRTVALGADVSEAAVAVVELAPRPLLDGGGTDALIDLTFSDARDPLVARKKYLRFSFNLENDLEAIFGLEDFEQVYCRPIVQSVNKTSISMPVLRFQRAVNRMVNVIRLATPLRPAPPTAAVSPPSGLAAGGVPPWAVRPPPVRGALVGAPTEQIDIGGLRVRKRMRTCLPVS